jgi:hypothetical protein
MYGMIKSKFQSKKTRALLIARIRTRESPSKNRELQPKEMAKLTANNAA